jgi:hypothetical protein
VAKNQRKDVPPAAFSDGTASKKKWKEPVFGAIEAIDGKLPLMWRFSTCDRGGPFSWADITAAEMIEIMQKIPEFETKTWDQLQISPVSFDSYAQVREGRAGQAF